MNATTQAFFFDTRVQGWRDAAAALPEGSLWFEIDSTQDRVERIRQALSGLSGLQAIHIVSHGSASRVQLGSGELSKSTLTNSAQALGEIGASLAKGSDILRGSEKWTEGLPPHSRQRKLAQRHHGEPRQRPRWT